MSQVYLHPVQVVAEHIDLQGHVNNLVYLKWMQDAAVAHSLAKGWGMRQYNDLGCAWVVRSHQIEYRLPAFEHDNVVVRTWVDSFRRASCVRRYEIQRPKDHKILAHAETHWALLDLKRRLPVRVPREIVDAFLSEDPMISSGS